MKIGPLVVSVRHLYHQRHDFRTVEFIWRNVEVHSCVGGYPWREMSLGAYLSLLPAALHSLRRVIREIVRIEQGKKTQ